MVVKTVSVWERGREQRREGIGGEREMERKEEGRGALPDKQMKQL